MFKTLTALAALAIAGQASAAVSSESFDAASSTYSFTVMQIADGEVSFSFTANADDGIVAGIYDIVGDVSATNFSFTGGTLNGADWDLYADNKGKVRFGSIELTSSTDLVLEFTGTHYGAQLGNFQGSLVLQAVPEAETYAMMIAGLGVLGFVARRRKG